MMIEGWISGLAGDDRIMPGRDWLEGVVCFVDRTEVRSAMIADVEARWNGLKEGDRFPIAADGENVSHCLSIDDFTLVLQDLYAS